MAIMMGLAIASGPGNGAGIETVPNYELGEVATEEVRAPMELEVIDVEKTDEDRKQAAARIPTIYRFDMKSGLEAEAALRKDCDTVRAQFWASMEQASQRSTLDAATVNHPTFARFVEWFRERHPGFPMDLSLAKLWAMREADENIMEGWLKALRRSMNQCLGPEPAAEDGWLGGEWVRVVPIPGGTEEVSERKLEKDGMTLRKEEMETVTRARAALLAEWNEGSIEAATYVAGFIRENCVPLKELTRRMREKAMAAVLVVDRYESGAVLVEPGQVVDRKTKTALDLLRAELGLQRHGSLKDTGTIMRTWQSWRDQWRQVSSDPVQLERLARSGLVVLAGASLCGVLVLAVLVRRKRMRRRKSNAALSRDLAYTVVLNPTRNETVFLPAAGTASGSVSEPPSSPASGAGEATMNKMVAAGSVMDPRAWEMDRYWQQRANEAERRAEAILAQVRAGLAPQLARHMMHQLVRELISQRVQWLETQRLAEGDLVHLEKRLTASHEHLQQQLRAFEKRTVELEKALSVKAEENTALIKAQIAAMQAKAGPKPDVEQPIWN